MFVPEAKRISCTLRSLTREVSTLKFSYRDSYLGQDDTGDDGTLQHGEWLQGSLWVSYSIYMDFLFWFCLCDHDNIEVTYLIFFPSNRIWLSTVKSAKIASRVEISKGRSWKLNCLPCYFASKVIK
jgi:hypothetical protein